MRCNFFKFKDHLRYFSTAGCSRPAGCIRPSVAAAAAAVRSRQHNTAVAVACPVVLGIALVLGTDRLDTDCLAACPAGPLHPSAD